MKKTKVVIAAVVFIFILSGLGLAVKNTTSRTSSADIEKITVCTQPSFFPYSHVYHITPDRRLVHERFEGYYNYFKDPKQSPIETEEKILSEEEYAGLVGLISDNKFMKLPESISDTNILDGSNVYMEVQMNGDSHIVGGYMPQYANEGFKNIYTYFAELLYWEEKPPYSEEDFKINVAPDGGAGGIIISDIKVHDVREIGTGDTESTTIGDIEIHNVQTIDSESTEEQ